MTRWRNAGTLAAVALAAAALTTAPAPAADHEASPHKKVRIEKIVGDCEGAACDDATRQRRVIVIDGDGAHEHGAHLMRLHGAHGMHAPAIAGHGKGGFLGVATTELTPELRRHFGVPEEAGVLVSRVVDDSAAASAGVEVGDILTAVAGTEIASTGELLRAVGDIEPGAAVNLELWRDGTLQTLAATLGERPRPRHHALLTDCGDGGVDCPRIVDLGALDCAGESECEVRIECREAGCECTVNGRSAECETLPGFEAPGD